MEIPPARLPCETLLLNTGASLKYCLFLLLVIEMLAEELHQKSISPCWSLHFVASGLWRRNIKNKKPLTHQRWMEHGGVPQPQGRITKNSDPLLRNASRNQHSPMMSGARWRTPNSVWPIIVEPGHVAYVHEVLFGQTFVPTHARKKKSVRFQ